MIPYKNIPIFNHERLLSKIAINDNGCWVVSLKMKKCKGKETYPVFTINKTEYLAHRVSFSIFKNLSNLLVVDHICRNKSCINPDHLRQVTMVVNALENSVSIMALNKLKTHGNCGHEFTKENTILMKNSQGRKTIVRKCRICENTQQRRKYLRRKTDGQ